MLELRFSYDSPSSVLHINLDLSPLHVTLRGDDVLARGQIKAKRTLPILVACTGHSLSVDAVDLNWATMDARYIVVVEHIAFAVDIKDTLWKRNLRFDDGLGLMPRDMNRLRTAREQEHQGTHRTHTHHSTDLGKKYMFHRKPPVSFDIHCKVYRTRRTPTE
jgi:hypothetical protein